jgi:hypothetical protein
MTEDELKFLDEIHDETSEQDFEAWIESMEQSFADGEFSSFCK